MKRTGSRFDHFDAPFVGAFIVAAAMFVALGAPISANTATWHEELSVHVSDVPRSFQTADDGVSAVVRSWCDPQRSVQLTVSDGIRPRLAVCAADRIWPVMIDSYMSGVFYWPLELASPLHLGDPFRLRIAGLLLGVATLFIVGVLVRRLAGRALGALAMLFMAVTSSFVYTHSLLIFSELLPSTLLAVAGLVVTTKRRGAAGGVSRRRVVAVAVLVAAAVLANVKALFLIVPLAAVLAVRHRSRLRSVRPLVRAIACLVALVVVAPMWLFALLDPRGGFSEQVGRRLQIVPQKLAPSAVFEDAVHLLRFWTDLGAFANPGQSDVPVWASALVLAAAAAAAALWCAVAAARYALGRSDDVVAALAGAALLFYAVAAALVYDQQPGANFAPLHTVFPVAMAAAVWRLGRLAPSGSSRLAVTALVALTLTGALTANILRRDIVMANPNLMLDAHAQRTLADRLRALSADAIPADGPTPEGMIVTSTYNVAGVFDALGRGSVRTVRIHRFLLDCVPERPGPDDELFDCLRQRWASALEVEGALPMRVIVPASQSIIDEPYVDAIVPALTAAATPRGLQVELEAVSASRSGVPVLHLILVDRPR